MANLDSNYGEQVTTKDNLSVIGDDLSQQGALFHHNAKQTAMAHDLVNQALSSVNPGEAGFGFID